MVVVFVCLFVLFNRMLLVLCSLAAAVPPFLTTAFIFL